jgi:hypothetical protein
MRNRWPSTSEPARLVAGRPGWRRPSRYAAYVPTTVENTAVGHDEEFVVGHDMADGTSYEEHLSEVELTALALAADPDAPLSDDAVPLSLHLAQFAGAALPQWYMPPAMARHGSKWRVPVVGTIIAAFVLIEALGLCNTFGILNFA